MGQTLNHGVYLPAEGERNCYSGLASNWNLLDAAIGDIAGKASATHTHGNISNDGKVGTTANLPLITGTGGAIQAGSFGNAANTFCEGNDSRLSDARTPVAHTHTKSDVTDLLNSNFIPSANNSYDLGSSSYQWNNLYAKNYYYNGTAWGLDQANTWLGVNTFSDYSYTNSGYGFVGQGNRISYILPEFASGYSGLSIVTPDFNKSVKIGVWTTDANTGKIILNQSGAYLNISAGILDGVNNITITPRNATNSNIGDSNNKWKSLNGINPGALSLPDYLRILNIDTTNWSKAVGQNNYTPAFDGWLQITIPNDTDGNGEKSNFITILDSGFDPFTGITASDSKDYRIQITFPVVANHEYYIYIKSYSQTIMAARLIKCLGNVV